MQSELGVVDGEHYSLFVEKEVLGEVDGMKLEIGQHLLGSLLDIHLDDVVLIVIYDVDFEVEKVENHTAELLFLHQGLEEQSLFVVEVQFLTLIIHVQGLVEERVVAEKKAFALLFLLDQVSCEEEKIVVQLDSEAIFNELRFGPIYRRHLEFLKELLH